MGILTFGICYTYFTQDVPVTEEDKKLILSAFDIKDLYGDYEPSEQHEVLSKIKYPDGSSELSYEYDSPNEDDPTFQFELILNPQDQRREHYS